jgi:hypothetical protein
VISTTLTAFDASPDFVRLWGNHDVSGYSTRDKDILHPAVGKLRFKSASLGVHATPGARMLVYTAADDATRAAIGTLADGTATYPAPPCGHRLPASDA